MGKQQHKESEDAVSRHIPPFSRIQASGLPTFSRGPGTEQELTQQGESQKPDIALHRNQNEIQLQPHNVKCEMGV